MQEQEQNVVKIQIDYKSEMKILKANYKIDQKVLKKEQQEIYRKYILQKKINDKEDQKLNKLAQKAFKLEQKQKSKDRIDDFVKSIKKKGIYDLFELFKKYQKFCCQFFVENHKEMMFESKFCSKFCEQTDAKYDKVNYLIKFN